MSGAIACAFRVVFQILTTFLFLGFLLTAVGGIVLKTSTSALQSILTMAINDHMASADDVNQMATFLTEIADTMATYPIVIGLMLAVLSLIGLIASCSGWNKVLKIYAGILFVLLVIQIIVVAVVFSDPTKFTNDVVLSMEALLKSYGDKSEEGNKSTIIWDLLMEAAPQCCGMDGFRDFEKLDKDLPLPCCNMTAGYCNATTAEIVGVKGCRSKVEIIGTIKSMILLWVSIATIFMQALLIVLVLFLICAAKKDDGEKDV